MGIAADDETVAMLLDKYACVASFLTLIMDTVAMQMWHWAQRRD